MMETVSFGDSSFVALTHSPTLSQSALALSKRASEPLMNYVVKAEISCWRRMLLLLLIED
jgi:hypothetical protein